jgi:uncharacterized protein with PhoU and TrkA domain
MSEFEQINLTESPENHGQATFDVAKVVAMGIDNDKILQLLLKTLQPLGKAMEHVIHPNTGVAVVDMGGKLEIIAIRRIVKEG